LKFASFKKKQVKFKIKGTGPALLEISIFDRLKIIDKKKNKQI